MDKISQLISSIAPFQGFLVEEFTRGGLCPALVMVPLQGTSGSRE